jgi:hypothetical protein
MLRRYNILIALVCGTTLAVGMVYFFFSLYPRYDNSSFETAILTFSNTDRWDYGLLNKANDLPTTRVDLDAIELRPPPTNNSLETRREIKMLLDMRDLRDRMTVQRIRDENDGTTTFMGIIIDDLDDIEKQPILAPLINYSMHDLSILIFRKKREHDRVRPVTLRRDIEPVIPTPHHPSYPSGHAAQFHLLAYIVGAVYPELRDGAIAEARAITRRREIAGVHYQSDSTAGILLATEYFNALLKDTEFVRLLNQARNKRTPQR